MLPFTHLTGPAAHLPLANVDTDLIIPKQFLKTLQRTGLGRHLFHDLRYDEEGRECPDFLLNRAPYREARILLAGPNFGCGSSREHAPWALLDFGIRCVIAPSFADIFHENCFKNGILPLVLDGPAIEALAKVEAPLTVDLPAQEVRGGELRLSFDVDPSRKAALMEGLDEIGLTERLGEAVAAFEASQRDREPWLYGAVP